MLIDSFGFLGFLASSLECRSDFASPYTIPWPCLLPLAPKNASWCFFYVDSRANLRQPLNGTVVLIWSFSTRSSWRMARDTRGFSDWLAADWWRTNQKPPFGPSPRESKTGARYGIVLRRRRRRAIFGGGTDRWFICIRRCRTLICMPDLDSFPRPASQSAPALDARRRVVWRHRCLANRRAALVCVCMCVGQCHHQFLFERHSSLHLDFSSS